MGKFWENEGLKWVFGKCKGLFWDLGTGTGRVWPHGLSPGRTVGTQAAQTEQHAKIWTYPVCGRTDGRAAARSVMWALPCSKIHEIFTGSVFHQD